MTSLNTHPVAALIKRRADALFSRRLLDAAVHWTALAGAIYVADLTAGDAQWDSRHLVWLCIIAGLTIISELVAILVPQETFYLSGSLLGITLTAVLIGGTPAAILGALSVCIGWLNTREEFHKFRHNIVNYMWFPLLSGLFFHVATSRIDTGSPPYYLLVLAAFLLALTLNFILAAGYVSFLTRTSFVAKAPQLRPMIVAEMSSAILTLIAVYLTLTLKVVGLVLFALVLVLFQYLVGELLQSVRRERKLKVLATTDELTGLANRDRFETALGEEIESAIASGTAFGVMLLDLDRFKDINDTLGHKYGDNLLKKLGHRFAERLGENTVIARFGGDEFAIMPEERTGSIDEISGLAQRVLDLIKEPITIESDTIESDTAASDPLSVTLSVDASVGVVRFPADGTHGAAPAAQVQTLLRRADLAMYAAKEHRDGYRIYNPEYERDSSTQLNLLSDFLRALEEDELVLFYHPIVDLVQQRVSGAEALVRWEHPERGLLPPNAFIGLVEQTGLIGQLTETVLDKALAECAKWRAAGQDLSVGVNLSMKNLLDQQLPDLVSDKLTQYSVPPESLKLEITERMIMSDPDRAVRTVRKLGALGVKIAVDDFGTGHSSLANLRLLPIDELKIDRSFVTPMLSDQSDMVIVRSTIDLGHALGLKVIAEGVENAETLRTLESMGCDRAQGHFMSTPMPPAQFPDWSRSFQEGYRSAA